MKKGIRFIGSFVLLLVMLLTGLNIVVQRHHCQKEDLTEFHFYTLNHTCEHEVEVTTCEMNTCCSKALPAEEPTHSLTQTCCEVDYGVIHLGIDYTPFPKLSIQTPLLLNDVPADFSQSIASIHNDVHHYTAPPPPINAGVYRAKIQVYLI